jgi:DNA invertase Pin-like site-specific DNA recombinase
MERDMQQKITAEHLERNAYLYVRQACRQETPATAEGTQRQYALRERAIHLGWKEEQVLTIDGDLGESGGSSRRSDFERLVVTVRRGGAGLVMALDATRLARRLSDWQALLESCALTGTLLLLDDALLDPSRRDDRMLLVLKPVFTDSRTCRRSGRTLLAGTRRGPRGRRSPGARPQAPGGLGRARAKLARVVT